jgi:cyclopropane fatty-acyl-phospholipid synthase-like methyltransferase
MIEGLRSVLSSPRMYALFFDLGGGPRRNRTLVREYIHPKVGDSILDIGCGPGSIVPYLPNTEYLGFDASSEYIDHARKRFPHMRFVCERVSRFAISELRAFDIVLALGIIHHLDDAEAVSLFRIAHDTLKPGGRLITVDGVWTTDQSRVAKYLLARDRGRFVRTVDAYQKLASGVFSRVQSNIRHDLLRFPYTLIILECTR